MVVVSGIGGVSGGVSRVSGAGGGGNISMFLLTTVVTPHSCSLATE